MTERAEATPETCIDTATGNRRMKSHGANALLAASLVVAAVFAAVEVAGAEIPAGQFVAALVAILGGGAGALVSVAGPRRTNDLGSKGSGLGSVPKLKPRSDQSTESDGPFWARHGVRQIALVGRQAMLAVAITVAAILLEVSLQSGVTSGAAHTAVESTGTPGLARIAAWGLAAVAWAHAVLLTVTLRLLRNRVGAPFVRVGAAVSLSLAIVGTSSLLAIGPLLASSIATGVRPRIAESSASVPHSTATFLGFLELATSWAVFAVAVTYGPRLLHAYWSATRVRTDPPMGFEPLPCQERTVAELEGQIGELAARNGGMVAMIGEWGAGKSTVLRLAGRSRPTWRVIQLSAWELQGESDLEYAIFKSVACDPVVAVLGWRAIPWYRLFTWPLLGRFRALKVFSVEASIEETPPRVQWRQYLRDLTGLLNARGVELVVAVDEVDRADSITVQETLTLGQRFFGDSGAVVVVSFVLPQIHEKVFLSAETMLADLSSTLVAEVRQHTDGQSAKTDSANGVASSGALGPGCVEECQRILRSMGPAEREHILERLRAKYVQRVVPVAPIEVDDFLALVGGLNVLGKYSASLEGVSDRLRELWRSRSPRRMYNVRRLSGFIRQAVEAEQQASGAGMPEAADRCVIAIAIALEHSLGRGLVGSQEEQ